MNTPTLSLFSFLIIFSTLCSRVSATDLKSEYTEDFVTTKKGTTAAADSDDEDYETASEGEHTVTDLGDLDLDDDFFGVDPFFATSPEPEAEKSKRSLIRVIAEKGASEVISSVVQSVPGGKVAVTAVKAAAKTMGYDGLVHMAGDELHATDTTNKRSTATRLVDGALQLASPVVPGLATVKTLADATANLQGFDDAASMVAGESSQKSTLRLKTRAIANTLRGTVSFIPVVGPAAVKGAGLIAGVMGEESLTALLAKKVLGLNLDADQALLTDTLEAETSGDA